MGFIVDCIFVGFWLAFGAYLFIETVEFIGETIRRIKLEYQLWKIRRKNGKK
jgi:hypothetical protein